MRSLLLLLMLCGGMLFAGNPQTWRAELVMPYGALPFFLEVTPAHPHPRITVCNDKERIELEYGSPHGDSLVYAFPVFQSELRFIPGKRAWNGAWFNTRKSASGIPFRAVRVKAGTPRFGHKLKPAAWVPATGYHTWFTGFGTGGDTSHAVGKFERMGANGLRGTFLTSTGDYRFLEGNVSGDSLFLSCFDGAHTYQFRAKIGADGSLDGIFRAGQEWKEHWTAVPDPTYALPDPLQLTSFRTNCNRMDFSLRDLITGDTVRLESYRGKVVVVEFMGSWCPNCKDESLYLKELKKKWAARGVAFISIAFETTPDFTRAQGPVQRMEQQLGMDWPVLFGGRVGDKANLMQFPCLDAINAYPTTFFVSRQGTVEYIYTGFSGPATGAEWEKLQKTFEELLGILVTH